MTNSDLQIETMDPSHEPSVIAPVVVTDPLTLTIFGATGDLTHRKLLPALYATYVQGLLPDKLVIIGFARRDYNDESFRAWMAESIREFSRIQVEEEKLTAFLSHLYYHRGDLNDPAAYLGFSQRMADAAFPQNHLFYLSVAPSLFEPVLDQLQGAGLIAPPGGTPWSRVVVEKPFGRDLASARSLNESVSRALHESQVYRIDHYLGKESVQNILSFRFANAIFEPLFSNRYVHHVQITAGETVGMEKGRGAYFDATGSLRDMVQNHMMQLLCLVAMEPPSSFTAHAIHNEKLKVLESVSPLTPKGVRDLVVRAQYTSGVVNGKDKCGYREEDRVDPNSSTDTYVAMELAVNNWRWSGVPFYLRTGKRLQKRATEISIEFKAPPHRLFQLVECEGDVCDLTAAKANVLTFRLQPNEGITLQFAAKRPVMQIVVETVKMTFNYASAWQRALPDAYERLLMDVMLGDATLFTRSDEVEAAWQIIEPLLQSWQQKDAPPPATYPAGSWGPAEADALIARSGSVWINPE